MSGVIEGKRASQSGRKRFGTETDVETIYGISRRTLQKHRVLRKGLTFYRYGRKILYDLAEVERQIRAHASKGSQP